MLRVKEGVHTNFFWEKFKLKSMINQLKVKALVSGRSWARIFWNDGM